jgi:hypothetical protein
MLDGVSLTDNLIPLVDDGSQHEVGVLMGTAPAPKPEKEGKEEA